MTVAAILHPFIKVPSLGTGLLRGRSGTAAQGLILTSDFGDIGAGF